MDKKGNRSDRSEKSESGDGGCPFYERMKNRPNVYSDIKLPHQVTSRKDSGRKPLETGNDKSSTRRMVRPPTPMPKPIRRGLDRGDFANNDGQESNSSDSSLKGEYPDESIKIHSLSSKATIVVPETSRTRPVKDSVMQYENNYIRPRSAYTPSSILKNSPISGRTNEKTPRKNVTFASRSSSASSTKTIVSNPNFPNSRSSRKRPEQVIMEEEDDDEDIPYFPTSSRPDTVTSVHEAVHPRHKTPRVPNPKEGGYFSPPSTATSWLDAGDCSRPRTASNEVVHRSFVVLDDAKIAKCRQHFQIQEESYNYNEWREGMADPGDDMQAVKELVQKLYEVDVKEMTTDQRTKYYVYKVLLGRMVELLDNFAYLPTPPGYLIRCRVTRRRNGIDGSFFPQYFMHLERLGEPDVFIMTARKTKSLLGTSYVICTDPADVSTKSQHCLGVLESNVRGSEFTLYPDCTDDQLYSNSDANEATARNSNMWNDKKNRLRPELLKITYESNPLGFKGPRKIKVDIPKMKSDYERLRVQEPFKDAGESVLHLKNKEPVWNPETYSFILNFQNRVSISSVKNFQLVHPEIEDIELLQFGRHDRNTFILDFRYPFCPFQAFAVGLSSFDVKWGLE